MSESKVNLNLGLRDYEVLVWTLLDSYIATLKWSKTNHKGQILDAKMSLVDDGTESFSFTIPMYLYMQDGDSMIKVENPIWYMTLDDGTGDIIIKNMHKIKVIINKTMGTDEEKKDAGERVYEFLITKVTDFHEEDKPECKVECEGLAFHELGKQGYKTELSSEVLYNRLTKFSEGKTWYDNNHIGHLEEPKETIDYWMNDVGIGNYYRENQIDENGIYTGLINRTSRAATKWYYKIEMNYKSYSLLPTGLERDIHTLYEEAYISSWDDHLDPVAVTAAAEKCRLVDAKESNLYNLTLTIAETFEVFCRYEYEYDDNYCIIGRNIIFYNNFILDDQAFVDLTYPHTSVKIEREYDGTEITTKMFVRPEDDESTLTGLISIIDTDANPTKEDYIMNFDYLHKIGTISDELYDSIKPFEEKVREINVGNSNLLDRIKIKEPNPLLLSRRVVGDRVYVYTPNDPPNGYGHWEMVEGIVTTDPDELLDISDELLYYVPSAVATNSNAVVDEKTYTYTPAGWVDESGECVEGLIDLQERLIAKEERKVEVDALITVNENTVKNALERIADAESNYNNKTPQDVGITLPRKRMVLTDENGTKYINLGTADREIDFNSIRVYRKWDSKAAARDKATEIDAFPVVDTVTPPAKSPITINWNATCALNAKDYYKEIFKVAREEDYSGTDADLQILFESWCSAINDADSTDVKIPSTVGSHIEEGSTEEAFYRSIDILNDHIGWVLYAAGYASLAYMNSKKFKRYVFKAFSFNGKTYKLGDLTKQNKIGKNAWNELIEVRKAWRVSIVEGVNRKTDFTNLVCHPTSWLGSYSANVTVSCAGSLSPVLWHYSNMSAKDLLTIWQNNLRGNYSSYYDFLSTVFKVAVTPNKIEQFSAKRDSNNSLIALVDLPYDLTTDIVYLLYTWNPDTYWSQIAEIWLKKGDTAASELIQYRNELDLLEVEITALKELIRKKLKKKHDLIASFTAMMGPALRESYWQPENYHNYGDVYTATLGVDKFKYSTDNDTEKKVHAKFIWDTELFSEEQKNYYDYGINLTPRYYECLDFLAIYHSLDNDVINLTALLNNVENIAILFYDDNLDREHKNSNGTYSEARLLKIGTFLDEQGNNYRSWYYDLTYTSEGHGSFSRKILVSRKESSKRTYAAPASILFGFVRKKEVGDNNNYAKDSVIPILILLGLDELPDETIHFIRLPSSDPWAVADENEITPGALPCIGYINITTNEFIKICDFDPSFWLSLDHPENYETAYPRIKINSLQLKRNELILTCSKPSTDKIIEEANLLSRYYDYTIFNRRNDYLVTIKPEVFFRNLGSDLPTAINLLRDVAFNNVVEDDPDVREYMSELKELPYTISGSNITISIPNKTELSIALENVQTAGVLDKAKLKAVIQNDSHFNLCYPFNLTYIISNGGTYIYIDAQKVLKENSVPKVAYTVLPNLMYRTTNKFAQYALGQIVMINDYELKLENVFGYISEITMDLDHPWEDEITVKDYKNKFEDLFSSITAEVEEMKKNGGLLNALGTGVLTPTLAQSVYAINLDFYETEDFGGLDWMIEAYLNAHFDGREVVIEELNDILGEAVDVLNSGSMALGYLENSLLENASLFSSIVENIGERLSPSVYNITGNDPNAVGSGVGKYKIGDICIAADGSRYMAVEGYESSSGTSFKPVYDGTTSLIKGASMEIDADKGIVNMLAEHLINIKSGNSVHIAADADVNIVGNLSVNIGGSTINICSTTVLGVENDDPLLGEGATVDVNVEGGVNILSSAYDEINPNRNTLTGVFIKPSNIEFISSDITMVAGFPENETNTHNVSSCLVVSGKRGIFMGTNTNAGIRMYAGVGPEREIPASEGQPALTVIDPVYFDETILNNTPIPDGNILHTGSNFVSGSTLELLPNRIFFGTSAKDPLTQVISYGTSVYMDSSQFIISTGDASTYKNKTITNSSGLIGARFTRNSIGFATTILDTTTNQVTGINGLLMNDDGISMASGDYNITDVNDSIVDPQQGKGTFLRLSPKGIRLGGTGTLYINMDNFKLLTNNYGTSFAVGHGFNSDFSRPNLVGMVYTGGLLYVGGDITASSFTALGTNYKLIMNATSAGFYTNTNVAVLTIGLDSQSGRSIISTGGDLLISTGTYLLINSGNLILGYNSATFTGTVNATGGNFTNNVYVGYDPNNASEDGENNENTIPVKSSLNILNGWFRMLHDPSGDVYIRFGLKYMAFPYGGSTGLYYLTSEGIDSNNNRIYGYRLVHKTTATLKLVVRGWIGALSIGGSSGANKTIATFTRDWTYVDYNSAEVTTSTPKQDSELYEKSSLYNKLLGYQNTKSS